MTSVFLYPQQLQVWLLGNQRETCRNRPPVRSSLYFTFWKNPYHPTEVTAFDRCRFFIMSLIIHQFFTKCFFIFCFNSQSVRYGVWQVGVIPTVLNLVSAGDTDFSPPTAAVKLLLQFIQLPTLHLEVGDFLLFCKSSSLPKTIAQLICNIFRNMDDFYKKSSSVKVVILKRDRHFFYHFDSLSLSCFCIYFLISSAVSFVIRIVFACP